MIRPLHTWVLFGLCLVLATGAMGWVSWTALRLDAAEILARGQAAHEENVRLALWRMDSKLSAIIAQESARPYFVYQSFYPAERAYTRMYAELRPDEILLPSPLLTFASPDVLVYFQIDPDGNFTSPQVPREAMLDLAETGYTSPERVDAAAKQLTNVKDRLRRDLLLAALPKPEIAPDRRQVVQRDTGSPGYAQQRLDYQSSKSQREFSRRAEYNQVAQQIGSDNSMAQTPRRDTAPVVSEGVIKPLWVGDLLVLARRVSVGSREYVQGCLLNWPDMKQSLLAGVADLLPHAKLEPMPTDAAVADHATQTLAAVPVRLAPGPIAEQPVAGASPIRIALLVAWTCLLLAALAVGVLLVGAVTLSERRGAFVSAVTHELRTPLTTLRMYTEMLVEGMVGDEEKRRNYLQTMQVEADRLGHLVENVLAYSRIEHGRARGQPVVLTLVELIGRMGERLHQRAEQAGMNLTIEPGGSDQIVVRADPSAVEQVMFNLVDNACKYAASAADKSIHIDAGLRDGRAFIGVRDHGPGVSSEVRRRLFHPFCKSARAAADSAPGVGLGLALSRSLARQMGGDLCLSREDHSGASFVLFMPLA